MTSPMVSQIAGISALALALGGGYWLTQHKPGTDVSVTAAAQGQSASFLQPKVRNPRAQLNGPVGGVFHLVDPATGTTIIGISDNQKAARYAVAITLPNRQKITLADRVSFTQPDAGGQSKVSYAGTGRMSPTRPANRNQPAKTNRPAGGNGPEFTTAGKLKLTGKSVDVTLSGSINTRTGAGQVTGTAGQRTFHVTAASPVETPLQDLKDVVTIDTDRTMPGVKVMDPGRTEPFPGDCKNPKNPPENPWQDRPTGQGNDTGQNQNPGQQKNTRQNNTGQKKNTNESKNAQVARPVEPAPQAAVPAEKPDIPVKANQSPEPNQTTPQQPGHGDKNAQHKADQQQEIQKPGQRQKPTQQDPFADPPRRKKARNRKWPRGKDCWGERGFELGKRPKPGKNPGHQDADRSSLPKGSYIRLGNPRSVNMRGVGQATAVVPAEIVDSKGKVTGHLRFAMEYHGGSWQVIERYSVSGPNR